ncbi:MAG TPA: NlpC/P60 family protein [Micromonosporaceae bacterium]|nr:NlpC/P60 family protein [Micromonosporaceae bacterium]
MGTAAAVGVMVVAGATAHAGPSVSDLERQIDQAWNQLEPLIEKHNATRIELAANRKKVADLTTQIAPLQQQVDLADAKISALAVSYYKGSRVSALNALLTTGTPLTLADQLSMLEQVARVQKSEISDVTELKARYEEQKRPIDELVAQLAATEADMAAKEKQINAEIARLQVLRLQAYGTTGGLGVLRPVACPVNYPGGKAGVAVKFACSQIGKPYLWAADGPGSYDCSGLTMTSWRQAGIYLPHNAAAQRRSMPYVSRANLRPGDLVFYFSDLHHVGMYVGDGWIVHAPRAGDVVRMRRMDSMSIHSYGRPA